MNEQTQIILAPKLELCVPSIGPAALESRDAALAASAVIGRVENAAQNETAVRVHIALKSIANQFEKARKAAKEPALEYGRAIDRVVAKELLEVEKEIGRISAATCGFQVQEQRRVAEEQRLQQEEIARIEREKNIALSKAETPEAAQQIQEAAQAATAAEAVPINTTRTTGQVTKTDWDLQVVNPYELAKFHPDCVKIEPLLGEIKRQLNMGLTIKGVLAEKKLVSSVRVGKMPSAIEI